MARRLTCCAAVLCCVLALVTASGCVRRLAPGTEDLPADVASAMGPHVDIDPRWSHDGARVAFLRWQPDRSLQLFVTDRRLGRPLALLEAELVSPDRGYHASLARYCSPDTIAWSPDDRMIAFERGEWFTFSNRRRLAGTGIWALDRYTGRVFPIAVHPQEYKSAFYFYHSPAWSADSHHVAFLGEGLDGQRVLMVRSLSGQAAEDVNARFDAFEESDWPVWRPQAGRAAECAFRQGIRRDIGVAPTETVRFFAPGSAAAASAGELTRIRPDAYGRELPAARRPYGSVTPRIGHLAWSRDGSRLAFTLTPDALDYNRYEIWVCNGARAGGARRVTPLNGPGFLAPVWIDSQTIGALAPAGGGYDAVAIDVSSGRTRLLTHLPTADCDWSPDRSAIACATAEPDTGVGGEIRLYPTGRTGTVSAQQTRLSP